LTNQKIDIAVIGGGASGFFAAINAKLFNPSLKVAIFESSNKLLSKVKISGGGRCNVTHACFDNKDLVKFYPRGNKELLSAFHQFSTSDTIAWFAEYGIELKIEEDGRMFPTTDDSQTIIDCFLNLTDKFQIPILKQHHLKKISKSNDQFHLEFTCSNNANKLLIASNVICCIGGFHKIEHYQIIKNLGVEIEKPIPSLFTFNIKDKLLHELMGLSKNNCTVSLPEIKLQYNGPLLVTHWGLSGPAVLKLSAYGALDLHKKNYHCDVVIDWEPEIDESELSNKLSKLKFEKGRSLPINTPIINVPKRLYEYLLGIAAIPENVQWANIKQGEIQRLITTIKNQAFKIQGKTTFKEEFVTAGGLKREEIDFRTMQSKKVPNLYFAGEIIDVDGITGGFNFQAAWTTAYIAAKNFVKKNESL
jgi:predicted Rossmann fold flavoprotein